MVGEELRRGSYGDALVVGVDNTAASGAFVNPPTLRSFLTCNEGSGCDDGADAAEEAPEPLDVEGANCT